MSVVREFYKYEHEKGKTREPRFECTCTMSESSHAGSVCTTVACVIKFSTGPDQYCTVIRMSLAHRPPTAPWPAGRFAVGALEAMGGAPATSEEANTSVLRLILRLAASSVA